MPELNCCLSPFPLFPRMMLQELQELLWELWGALKELRQELWEALEGAPNIPPIKGLL